MRTRRGGRLAFSTDTRMAPRISAVWASSRWPKPWPRASHLARRAGSRSEERRVGKEGRSRWGPDPLKKKNEILLGAFAPVTQDLRIDAYKASTCMIFLSIRI